MTTTTSTLPLPTPWRDKLNGILFVALMAAAVVQLADLPFIRQFGFSPLVVGIVCGMLYGNFLRGTMPADWGAGVHFTARRLLRIAVAFYGLNISIQQIAAVGLPGLAVSVGVVASTLLIGTVAGQRLLGLDRDTAMLTAAGSAICGAAAVLAFEPTLRAAPHKSAVA
ncbi:putative sulfate exporter family transporter, partial [Bordetella pertussis]